MINNKMKNGRYDYKICFKGTLTDDKVINKEENHRITEDEKNMTTLLLQMDKIQLAKVDSGYITFMQNIMIHTLALTMDKYLTVSVFEQLGVATGEIDLRLRNEKVREIYEDQSDRRKINRIKKIKEMDVHEWIWYLLTLRTTAIWTATPEFNEESQTTVRREAKK
jgi:hypothetical protein